MPAVVRLPSGRKYKNQPTECDGIRFDSKREARVYADLKLLERAGEIKNLIVDKKLLRFPLEANGILICTYVADFSFQEMFGNMIWGRVIADAKGHRTEVYKLKKRLMWALKGIQIREL